jgi:hypothetical protein
MTAKEKQVEKEFKWVLKLLEKDQSRCVFVRIIHMNTLKKLKDMPLRCFCTSGTELYEQGNEAKNFLKGITGYPYQISYP